jgi:hypothetical protein
MRAESEIAGHFTTAGALSASLSEALPAFCPALVRFR